MTDQKKKAFASLHETCEHLKAEGYKISKSKIYRDAEVGKITREPDGTVTAEAAREYAKTHLVKAETVHSKEDMKNLQTTKLKKAIRNQDIEYQRKKFDLEREQGRYVPRQSFEIEMTARARFFRSDMENFIRIEAPEIIRTVAGDPEKAPDLIEFYLEHLEKWLDRYSKPRAWKVPLPA